MKLLILWWFLASPVVGLAIGMMFTRSRRRQHAPDQWRRYRGAQRLRDEARPVDNRTVIRGLRRG